MRYHHLTLEERASLAAMRMLGFSLRQMATTFGRAPSTMSRELHRNTDSVGGYAGYWAQLDALRRRQQAPRPRRLAHPPLAQYVQAKLRARWSPEQIAHRLRLDFPHEPAMRLSHQTLYSWIAADRVQGGTYYMYLRQHRRQRRKRYGSGPRPPLIPGRVSIAQRPEIVGRRAVDQMNVGVLLRVGDWESDTVLGKGRTASVTTHVERRSRFLVAAKVPCRTAAAVNHATHRALRRLPPALRKTLTVDNGSEWVAFQKLQQTLGLRVYFATPYAAWERGTNENTNGLLRDYFPKSMDLSHISAQQLAKVVRALNNRPRKCLAYRTPAEVLSAMTGVALHT